MSSHLPSEYSRAFRSVAGFCDGCGTSVSV